MKSKHLVGKVTNSDGSNYWIIQNNNSPNNSMNHEHVESAFQSFNGSLDNNTGAPETVHPALKNKNRRKTKATIISPAVLNGLEFEISWNGAQINHNRATVSNCSTLPEAQLMDCVPKNEPGLAVDFVTNPEMSNKPMAKSNREALQRGNNYNESTEVEENICDSMNEALDHNSNSVDELNTENCDQTIESNDPPRQKKVKRSREHIERITRSKLKIALPDDQLNDSQINDNTAGSSVPFDDAGATKKKSNVKTIAKKTPHAQNGGRHKKNTRTKQPTREELATEDELAVDVEDRLYPIESILSHRLKNGACHFLIKWKGFGQKHDSWEPETSIPQQFISKYFIDNLS